MLMNELGMIIISSQDQMDFDEMMYPVKETPTWFIDRHKEEG